MTAVNANPIIRPATRRTPYVGYVRGSGLSIRPKPFRNTVVAHITLPVPQPRPRILTPPSARLDGGDEAGRPGLVAGALDASDTGRPYSAPHQE